jgi:hypothetical protein
VCEQLVIRSSAPKSQHDRLSGWAAREASGCNPCRRAANDLGAPGQVQPPCNTGAVASHQNQHVQRRKIPDSTRCKPGRRSQRLLYNFDTVGVTGSIPVSPTTTSGSGRRRRRAGSRRPPSRAGSQRRPCDQSGVRAPARVGLGSGRAIVGSDALRCWPARHPGYAHAGRQHLVGIPDQLRSGHGVTALQVEPDVLVL